MTNTVIADEYRIREERLETINAALAASGLSKIHSLGDHLADQIEFVGIAEMLRHNERFYTDVVFTCIFPGGATGRFPVRFNANSDRAAGAVMVVRIDGTFAIVNSFRPVLGRDFDEFARGFGESFDNVDLDEVAGNGVELGTRTLHELKLGTVLRELGEEVLEGTEPNVTYLGGVAENTGTHSVVNGFYLVDITLDEDGKVRLAKRQTQLSDEGHALKLWSRDELDDAIGTKLVDMHSLAAYALFCKYEAQQA